MAVQGLYILHTFILQNNGSPILHGIGMHSKYLNKTEINTNSLITQYKNNNFES
jgi:hypothetical protein